MILRPRRTGDLPVLVHVVSQRARVLRLRRTQQPLAFVIVTTFDPIKGRGREVARFYTDVAYAWDLSPDGTRIAVLKCLEGQLRLTIFALSSRTQQELTVLGWSRGQYVYWAADGNALFVSCSTQRGSVLSQVDFEATRTSYGNRPRAAIHCGRSLLRMGVTSRSWARSGTATCG